MTGISFANPGSFTRFPSYKAASEPQPEGCAARSRPSGRGSDDGSDWRSNRDILTLSRQGQAAYAKHASKESNEVAGSSEPVDNDTNIQQDVSEPADYIPVLTLNEDGMPILTHADGTTSIVEQVMTEKWVFTPGENDILALDSCPWGEVVGAYLDFRSQAAREIATIPQLSGMMAEGIGWGGIFLSHVFSQIPDVHNSSMQEFESYSARITQGIQDLRDVLDFRQKLGLGNDFFGNMHASVMASIINGKPESMLYTVMDGEKVSLGTEYTNASWLRALDKVTSAEGLAAARSREDAGLGLSYYDVKNGMQVMLQVTHTGGTGFSFNVMEYSLKAPNDKGTTVAQYSGNNFSQWLNSSGSNFLSQLYDNDFQDWLGMMKKRVVGWW